MEDSSSTVVADPEAAFLASKRRTGSEWEMYKENVRPSKRGRDVNLLNRALKSQHDPVLKKSLLERRRRMIDAIDEYEGEDPLQPWIECITWVQESFPTGGECSGLIVIYEQCVRAFWHEDRYKEDLRYLKIWLEYASNCADCEVIYRFLEANQIGQTKSIFYSSYALHMESKYKLKKADEIFNIGIARRAEPLDKLQFAYRKFILRSAGKNNVEDEPTDANLPVRSFGTVLATGENGRHPICGPTIVPMKTHMQRANANANAPFSIYDDANKSGEGHQPGIVKRDLRAWPSLGSQSDRNKENNSIPSKWTTHKIPQKMGFRPALAASSPSIEVFVDEECAKTTSTQAAKRHKSSILRQASSRSLKKDTELLKENPLRNFPSSSLPR